MWVYASHTIEIIETVAGGCVFEHTVEVTLVADVLPTGQRISLRGRWWRVLHNPVPMPPKCRY